MHLSILAFRPHWNGIFLSSKTEIFFKHYLNLLNLKIMFYIVTWTLKIEAFENDDACLIMLHISLH